ncbi:M48 family metallopeptidase [Silvibacterium sp.]|uniref:M48 family metallopeptidase n=1 Tax=Silvibacterium sp. TaxID=1964179 RepID=UPI0039E6D25E
MRPLPLLHCLPASLVLASLALAAPVTLYARQTSTPSGTQPGSSTSQTGTSQTPTQTQGQTGTSSTGSSSQTTGSNSSGQNAQQQTPPVQNAPIKNTPVEAPTKPPADAAPVTPDGNSTSTGPSATDKDKKTADSATPASGDVVPMRQANPDGTMPGVKSGSIEDVNAVGTRNIGGRGMGNWYSTESEIKMGKSYAMELEKSTKFITDPVVTEYVNRIGQNIVKNSDCKVPFTIKVIDTDEINAFALPGGFFYVNSGLILAADEEAELAGVMAHEIAHVCAHHAAREMTRANYAQIGTIPLIMIGGWTGYGIYEAANIAIPVTFLEFSREFEAQADYLGIQYMYRAGYDPQAFITFFEKIQDLEKHKPGAVAKVFSDHPQTPDRIVHSQEEIATILPARDEYMVTTSEFDDVKARLARIENKRRLTNGKNGQKPTLRKVSNSDPNSSSSGDDERPTLHRRDDSGSDSSSGSSTGSSSGSGTGSSTGSGTGSSTGSGSGTSTTPSSTPNNPSQQQ